MHNHIIEIIKKDATKIAKYMKYFRGVLDEFGLYKNKKINIIMGYRLKSTEISSKEVNMEYCFDRIFIVYKKIDKIKLNFYGITIENFNYKINCDMFNDEIIAVKSYDS
jgi:hypothetical protein